MRTRRQFFGYAGAAAAGAAVSGGAVVALDNDKPQQPAVARLISEGLTNGEIASELSIAPKTASSHVEHILAKLGASRRAEIAAWATAVVPADNGR